MNKTEKKRLLTEEEIISIFRALKLDSKQLMDLFSNLELLSKLPQEEKIDYVTRLSGNSEPEKVESE